VCACVRVFVHVFEGVHVCLFARESACVRERDRDVYMCMWKGALGGVSV